MSPSTSWSPKRSAVAPSRRSALLPVHGDSVARRMACLEASSSASDAERIAPAIERGVGPLRDIVEVISEMIVVEQILIRNLPAGTKAALKARAEQHRRSAEAEAREILADALAREPVTLVDLLGTDEGADIEFEPERLGPTARIPDL